MNLKIRNEILSLLEKSINYSYPIRWTDEKTTLGDFDGREFSIDVFNIPVSAQLDFLSQIREIRKKISEMIGSRCFFIFHTPAATKKHYSHLFPVTKGICIEDNTLKLSIPDITGTQCTPEISKHNQPIGFYIDLKKVAA